MDQIKARILAVISMLDQINVVGISNQRRVVACADYLTDTVKMIDSTLVELSKSKEVKNDDAG